MLSWYNWMTRPIWHQQERASVDIQYYLSLSSLWRMENLNLTRFSTKFQPYPPYRLCVCSCNVDFLSRTYELSLSGYHWQLCKASDNELISLAHDRKTENEHPKTYRRGSSEINFKYSISSLPVSLCFTSTTYGAILRICVILSVSIRYLLVAGYNFHFPTIFFILLSCMFFIHPHTSASSSTNAD